MLKSVATVSLAMALIAGQAVAQDITSARVASLDGAAMVNQGNGFVSVTGKTVLHAGDRVVAVKGGRAHLIYANGCQVAITGAATIGKAAACGDTDRTADQGGEDRRDRNYAIPLVFGGALVAGVVAIALSHHRDCTSP